MGAMEITHIEVSEDAMNAILQGVRDAKAQRAELGGSLLVHEEADGRVLVAYALPTGPNADRGWGHVRTDAAFQNAAIRKVRGQFPSLQYAGDWHVHPMYLPELSSTDVATAESILRDTAMGRRSLVLLLATTPPMGAPVVLAYIAKLSPGRGVVIGKLPITRVAPDSASVIARLGRPLPPLPALLEGDDVIVTSPEQQALDAIEDRPTARLIEDELAEIRQGLGADATLGKDEGLFAALIRRGEREVFVLFPPEYPLGAPRILLGAPGDGPLTPIPLRFGWSTLHRWRIPWRRPWLFVPSRGAACARRARGRGGTRASCGRCSRAPARASPRAEACAR